MADPARIVIPSIGVDAEVIPVGLKGRNMETPPAREEPSDPLRAGWYKLARKPGEDGPAVIVGHVDGRRGPDTFARLHTLKRGAEVTVTGRDGSAVTFVVKGSERTAKTAVDWERILNTKGSSLLLFTCGGAFDRRTGHYRDNIIVQAARA